MIGKVEMAKINLGNNVKTEIEKFDGSNGNFILWWNKRANYRVVGQWDDRTSVLYLLACLSGQALRLAQTKIF